MFELNDQAPVRQVQLLLLPGFAMHELALVRAALLQANRLAGVAVFEVSLAAMTAGEVQDEAGLPIMAPALRPQLATDLVCVLAGGWSPQAEALCQLNRDAMLAGVGWGAFWLAQVGLMNGYRASVHWQQVELFSEQFPQVSASTHLFELDRNRFSCGGGLAALDLTLAIIGRLAGSALAGAVSEALMNERMRSGEERQRIPLQSQLGTSAQPKLVKAVSLMESHLEEPLTTDEIADRVCVSRRQLERLFKQHLNSVPSQYYLELRLQRARQLLLQTSKSIIQIGLSCGFSSGPHFSSSYRNHFGTTPREDRMRHQPGRKPSSD
ncbi:transcriptional regulator GlxA family with amidase domain [Chitinivorax tropicus]|uniref:Transcriptional regulator GlxA family with amidase domain n=1 Tax=Chitinivorax tropicus TaxID=714531 RepID=A0A840MKA3_9PROT|nr:GlxA family transcriptional regulator [Chitinivorax tropicus]MBB5016996.1 transcriptional regulator GlxA family with amidase domain [Chitinivorax tropicus]